VDEAVRFVEVGDVRIAYRTSAPEQPDLSKTDPKLPVVLLHSLGEDSTTWDALSLRLAHDQRCAVALDLRGHGQSSWPGVYSFDNMCADIMAVLDALGIRVFDLVGHSLGGHLALGIAGWHPERVNRLIVEDPPPPPDATIVDVDLPSKPLQTLPFDWGVVALRQAIRTPDPDWWARLRSIECPTLIIAGGPTSHVDQVRLRLVSSSIRTCHFVEVDVGHSIHQAEPEGFGDLVIGALA
jgi:pimeloyl-ACP methyl ester carboxylesterase